MSSIIRNNTKLGNILKETLNSLKGDLMGENYIYWIDSTPAFDNEGNNYLDLKEFIKHTKEFMKIQADYYRMYSPGTFHENSFKNAEAGIKLYEQIESALNA